MKRILSIFFVLLLCSFLGISCVASGIEVEDTEEFDVKAYIVNEIVPVALGIATSIVAFLVTLGSVSRSLKSLKDTKEVLSNEAQQRRDFFEKGVEALEEKAKELSEAVKDLPALKDKVKELVDSCGLLAEILSLGFSANAEIVKSGKGKKMALLLENARCKITSSLEVNDEEKEIEENEEN